MTTWTTGAIDLGENIADDDDDDDDEDEEAWQKRWAVLKLAAFAELDFATAAALCGKGRGQP